MPTYEYHCDTCDKNFDVVQSFHDEALTACPTCGSPVRKVFGNVGIVFKGSGFYKTDSRNGGSAKSANGDGSAKAGSEGSGSDSSSDSGSSSDKPSAASTGDASSNTPSSEKKTAAAPTSTPSKAAPTPPAT